MFSSILSIIKARLKLYFGHNSLIHLILSWEETKMVLSKVLWCPKSNKHFCHFFHSSPPVPCLRQGHLTKVSNIYLYYLVNMN